MANTNYTTTENSELKKAYAVDLNNYLNKEKPEWIATPANITNQVFIRPKDDKEWYSFQNEGRMGIVNDKKAGQLIYMTACHSFRDSKEYKTLIEAGWKDDQRTKEKSPLFGLEKRFSKMSDLGNLIEFIESTIRKKL